MSKPIVTILIPNFKTPELTTLCLRLLRKFTDLELARVIVVDNHSDDASIRYLRTLPWITLIERDVPPEENGPQMHARALDLAMKSVDTEFVMVMHTDTLVLRADWLSFLLSKIQHSDRIGGVGSWKLEHFSPLKKMGKALEDFLRSFIPGKEKKEERYLRSHCALYRTELIRKFTNGFDDGHTAGMSLHRMLVKEGYQMLFLESGELGKYIRHLNHATGILNPAEGSRRCRKPEAKRKLKGAMDADSFREILNSPELDGIQK